MDGCMDLGGCSERLMRQRRAQKPDLLLENVAYFLDVYLHLAMRNSRSALRCGSGPGLGKRSHALLIKRFVKFSVFGQKIVYGEVFSKQWLKQP